MSRATRRNDPEAKAAHARKRAARRRSRQRAAGREVSYETHLDLVGYGMQRLHWKRHRQTLPHQTEVALARLLKEGGPWRVNAAAAKRERRAERRSR